MAFLAVLSLMLAHATAQQEHLFSRQMGYENLNTVDDFSDLVKDANASTSRNVTLPDLLGGYTNSAGSELGFAAWLHIVGPEDESTPMGRPSRAWAGLYPLDGVSSANGSFMADETWATCLSFTRFRDHGLSSEDTINSNCSNVFSDDCLDWLDSWRDNGDICLRPGKDAGWEDSPCGGELNNHPSNTVLTFDKAFRPTGPTNFSHSFMRTEDDPGDNWYDNFVQSIYLVTIGFARAENDSSGDLSLNAKAPAVPARMVCLRADEFSSGSRTLEDIEDAGDHVQVSARWMLLAGTAAAVVLSAQVF